MDLINALFEGGGALFSLLNVVSLVRHQRLQGVHWLPTLWFFGFGVWNLAYYPHLNQWLSFWAGMALVSVNLVWILLVAWFSGQNVVRGTLYR